GYSVNRGALITAVFSGTPAETAGLQEGTGEQLVDGVRYTVGSDVVVAVGDTKIGSADALIRELALQRPGDTVALDVWRAGENVALELTVGERPASAPGLC
ncbi:MAG: PDZ domain-containing protein, partial [Gaiellaceae bacterium]